MLRAYRKPRAHEPAMRIAEQRARENKALVRKALKDDADLKEMLLYTHQA